MITETLRLRFKASPIHQPRAWFLPGDSPADWLAEICHLKFPHAQLRLLVVPISRRKLHPIGVLVFGDGLKPEPTVSRCHAYGQLAGQLFLPVEGQLEPAITETELKELLTKNAKYVWHPTAGLIGYDPSEIRTVSDLLLPPTPKSRNWGMADAGIGFARRLVSIELIQPISLSAFLQSGQDDIGTQADSLEELPPAPEEPKHAPGGSAPMRPLAKFIRWIGSRAPQSASTGGGWMERLQHWANRVLSPAEQSARLRELSRLLNLLKHDPDQGLKYALPMGGDAPRGLAPPGTRLPSHAVDFRYPASGGGPADYWDIPNETRMLLTARYRDLAQREIGLGRYRRAAYIYAELLREMEPAVAALKTGGYYREAAAIYEERLNRPHEAAACLEEGGLWDEALLRYERLENYEKCGAIHRRLEQHEEADNAYRKAAATCCQRGEFLHAAKLYDEECRDFDQAIVTLRLGWHSNRHSQECLRTEFQLLGREGRHTDAEKRVKELIETKLLSSVVASLCEVLSETAGDYPDETVRFTAAESTRFVVSKQLIASKKLDETTESRQLLATIEKLAPEDRLLHRDCERYLRNEEARLRPKPITPSRRGIETVLLQTVQLPGDVIWTEAQASARHYYAVGYAEGTVVLLRGRWQSSPDPPQPVSWKVSGMLKLSGLLLAVSPNDAREVWLHPRVGPPLPQRLLPKPFLQTVVTPPWSTSDTLAIAQTSTGISWTVSGEELLVLSVYSSNQVPLMTRQILDSPGTADFNFALPIHARSEGVFLGLDSRLVYLTTNTNEETLLSHPILRLRGSAQNSAVRVAASFEEGGVVFWKDTKQICQFGHGLNCPLTAFTVTGKLIAADESRIEIYNSSHRTLTLQSNIPTRCDPLSVMPVNRNRFAVFYSDGSLSIYEVKEA